MLEVNWLIYKGPVLNDPPSLRISRGYTVFYFSIYENLKPIANFTNKNDMLQNYKIITEEAAKDHSEYEEMLPFKKKLESILYNELLK